MFWYVLLGFLAAFGMLCIIWVLCGSFLPCCVPCEAAILPAYGKELSQIRRFCWLRELGLVHGRLAVLDSRLSSKQQKMITERFSYIRFVSSEQWLRTAGEEPEDFVST